MLDRLTLALVAAACLFGGCRSHLPLTVAEADHPVDEPVQVQMRDGTHRTTLARPDGEGQLWLLGAGSVPVPIEEIAFIEHADPAWGAVSGALIGAGAAGSAFFIVGGMQFDPTSCDPTPEEEGKLFAQWEENMCSSFGWLDSALVGGAIGLGVGMMLGAVVGGLRTSRTRYDAEDSAPAVLLEVGPDRRGGAVRIIGSF